MCRGDNIYLSTEKYSCVYINIYTNTGVSFIFSFFFKLKIYQRQYLDYAYVLFMFRLMVCNCMWYGNPNLIILIYNILYISHTRLAC